MKDVRLLMAAFDPSVEIETLVRSCPEAGGITSFVGKVRSGDGVEKLELTHYSPLTLPGMKALSDQACERWDIMGLVVLHRSGVLCPGEPIVLVSAAARHRRDAILTVDFVMDHLKSNAWFWKREKRADGWHWIEPRDQDRDDLARWCEKESDI